MSRPRLRFLQPVEEMGFSSWREGRSYPSHGRFLEGFLLEGLWHTWLSPSMTSYSLVQPRL